MKALPRGIKKDLGRLAKEAAKLWKKVHRHGRCLRGCEMPKLADELHDFRREMLWYVESINHTE